MISSVTSAKTTVGNTSGDTELPDGSWDLVFSNNGERTTALLTGRITSALNIPHGEHEDITIVTFKPHVFLKTFQSTHLINMAISLPISGNYFTLGNSRFEIPANDNVELLLRQFEKQGVIESSKYVEDALNNLPLTVSLRTLQRSFKSTTGLPPYLFFKYRERDAQKR